MARKSVVLLVMSAAIFFMCSISSADVPDKINYQGKLTTAQGGCFNGTVSMTFTIYSDDQGTVAEWIETQAEVVVQDGVFSVLLGSVVSIPALVFDGNIKYLGVQVEDDPEMRPLKPMVSVAYAYRAGTADAGIGGWVDDGAVVRLKTSTDYVGIGTADPQGPLQVGGGTFIVTANNDVGIGTTNPTERLDVSGNIRVTGKATLGSAHNNTGAFAFVAGHGSAVTGDYSTVGGGLENMATDLAATVGGGEANWALQEYSTIGGGAGNNIHEGAFSTIGGGVLNVANGDTSTIGGGHHNDALGALSTVGGGDNNIASGRYSTVPGGLLNTALGDYSFAGGRRAKANHDGAFVWGDATDADFTSTAADQFLIRASGGVGIGTANPQASLHINGTTLLGGVATIETGERVQGEENGGARILGEQGDTPDRPAIGFFSVDGVNDGAGGNGIFRPSANAMAFATSSQERMRITADGNVGIGTTTPQGALDVSSTTGAFIVPRMTTAQRDALTAVNGMIIYNTTTNQFNFRENGAWVTK